MNLQFSVIRLQLENHVEVLDASRMTELERQVGVKISDLNSLS